MANEKQRKTFLSYSRVNTDFAKKLAKELKAEGFDVWFDQLDIPAGSRWDREVEKALRDCDIFMVIMTLASIDSENVLDEIGYAIDAGKRLLPVLLEPCEVPFRLRRFQYVDFTNKGFDDGLESAKDLLRGLIAQTTIPRGEVPAVSQDRQTKTDTDGRTKEDADRLAAQKTEADHLAKQKVEDERLVKAKAQTERKAKEDADRLAVQTAEADKLAKQKAEDERVARAKAEAERKAKEKAKSVEAIPVEIKAQPVSQTIPAQKPPFPRVLLLAS